MVFSQLTPGDSHYSREFGLFNFALFLKWREQKKNIKKVDMKLVHAPGQVKECSFDASILSAVGQLVYPKLQWSRALKNSSWFCRIFMDNWRPSVFPALHLSVRLNNRHSASKMAVKLGTASVAKRSEVISFLIPTRPVVVGSFLICPEATVTVFSPSEPVYRYSTMQFHQLRWNNKKD